MTKANHHAEKHKGAPIRSRGRKTDSFKTLTEIQTGIAERMGLIWTAVVGECVIVEGVCVMRPGLGQFMGNTARETTSPARTKGG